MADLALPDLQRIVHLKPQNPVQVRAVPTGCQGLLSLGWRSARLEVLMRECTCCYVL